MWGLNKFTLYNSKTRETLPVISHGYHCFSIIGESLYDLLHKFYKKDTVRTIRAPEVKAIARIVRETYLTNELREKLLAQREKEHQEPFNNEQVELNQQIIKDFYIDFRRFWLNAEQSNAEVLILERVV